MSALRGRAEDYLAMRRALGFRLTTQGRHLMSFIVFCEQHGAQHVTADLAIAWATQTARGSGNEVYQAQRLDVVRIFAATCGLSTRPPRFRLRTCCHVVTCGSSPICTARRKSAR